MKKIVVGDQVVVMCGKDKGRRGKVLRSIGDEKVLVEGVNVVKKHVRPNPTKGVEGGIVAKEMPIHVSNVGLLNPQTNKADRIGFRLLADGRKVRFFKSNNETVDA